MDTLKTKLFGPIREVSHRENCYSETQRHKCIQKDTKICLYFPEATGAISWQKHLNSNFDKMLESECGPARQ